MVSTEKVKDGGVLRSSGPEDRRSGILRSSDPKDRIISTSSKSSAHLQKSPTSRRPLLSSTHSSGPKIVDGGRFFGLRGRRSNIEDVGEFFDLRYPKIVHREGFFDRWSRKIEETPIFNLRSSTSKIEEPPIYDLRSRRLARRSFVAGQPQFCSSSDLCMNSFVRAFTKMLRNVFSIVWRLKMDDCILGEPIRRRPVLPIPAPPRRPAMRCSASTPPWYVAFRILQATIKIAD